MDEAVPSGCFKSRSVPLALQSKVEAELDRLVTEKMLKSCSLGAGWALSTYPEIQWNARYFVE